MNFNLENIIKGPVMTLFGLIIIFHAYWAWYEDMMTDTQAICVGVVGLILIFMKDEIPTFIKQLKDVIVSKFTNNQPPK